MTLDAPSRGALPVPVVLDVGTDNLGLLNTSLSLGERHARVRGPAYDAFIDQFVHTSSRLFPQAMTHREAFGAPNAHPILERYRHDSCTRNDDLQGTAAVVLAAILAAAAALFLVGGLRRAEVTA